MPLRSSTTLAFGIVLALYGAAEARAQDADTAAPKAAVQRQHDAERKRGR